jgi:hypothetical protein
MKAAKLSSSTLMRQTEAYFRGKYPGAYKLCHLDATGLRSAIVEDGGARLMAYAVRCWTERKAENGPLACFQDLECVWEFLRPNMENCCPVVLEVCLKPSRDFELWYRYRRPHLRYAPNRWDYERRSYCPAGTLFADRVLPLRVVAPVELTIFDQDVYRGRSYDRRATGLQEYWQRYQAMGLPMTWDAALSQEALPKEESKVDNQGEGS